MKKFLLILLIVIATSVKIEFDGTPLEGFWGDLWDKVKNFVLSLPDRLKAIHESLVEKGVWEDIVELVQKYGKPKAIELCTNLLKKEELCTDIINLLFIYIRYS